MIHQGEDKRQEGLLSPEDIDHLHYVWHVRLLTQVS